MARWLIWALVVIGWTIALEAPEPPPGNHPAGEFIITYKIIIAKAVHIAVYTVLTILSAWLPVPLRYRWLLMFFLMLHAWGTEMLQEALNPICHRSGLLSDVGFDVLGITLGIALSWRLWTRDGPVTSSQAAGQ